MAHATMSRRYTYPRLSAQDLSQALNEFGMTARQLARVTGAAETNVLKWLEGQNDIPVYVGRDIWMWRQDREALDLAIEWADQFATFTER